MTDTAPEAPVTEEPTEAATHEVDETPAANDVVEVEPELVETPAAPETPKPDDSAQAKRQRRKAGGSDEPAERPIPRVHPIQVELDDPWGDLPVQMRHYEDGTPAF